MQTRLWFGAAVALGLVTWSGAANLAAAELKAGFGAADITPEVGGGKPVYIAGYGMGREAEGVHDRLFVRCVVLESGGQRIAIASVDLVGLQYPQVQAIRAKLPQLAYVLVASTHNHEGPDVIGIWGRNPFHRGVDEAYLDLVVSRVAQAIQEAEKNLQPMTAAFGTAEDESLIGDSRRPYVKDGVIRVLRLTKAGTDELAGVVVVWSCHPESLGSKNRLITADFPWATVAALKERHKCPVVYLSGSVGGLMAPPDGRIHDASGKELLEGDFEYARRYGEEVAALASKAIDSAQPLDLAPFAISAKPIAVPVENKLYRTARALGVLQRDGIPWTGDFDQIGPPQPREQLAAVESEVAYLRLGELYVAGIPGEVYPEHLHGKFQEPAEPDADFPDAPLEPTIANLMPGKHWVVIGLANDELGYIIPKRQWDAAAPFAYGRDKSQYGEINSCGPEVAPVLMQALQRRVAAVSSDETGKWVPISDGVTTAIQNSGKKIGYPGLTAGVAVDRTTGDLYMVVCDQGVWKSSDQGQTFARVDGDAIGGRCETGHALNVAPAGKGLAAFMVYGGCGLTGDGGTKWSKWKSTHFDCGAVDWESGGKTLLAIRHESGGALAYSADEGQTWTDLGKGFQNGVGIFDAKTLVATKGQGILRSGDGGQNWTQVSDLPVIGGTMYVVSGVGYWSTETGLALSRDKGLTWSVPGEAVSATHGPYFGKDEKRLVIGTQEGLLETTDGSMTWKKVAPLPEGFTIHKSGQSYANFAWDPVHDIFYASTMGKPTYRWRR